jgi:glutamate dehydrogenase (NAD(P)+)
MTASIPDDGFRFSDDLGPAKVIHIHEPRTGLRAILVVDNVACGPAIGGVRMAPDVTVDECFRLARAMTLKNAAAGLPHGGGKSVIVGNPAMPTKEKERIIRAFARAIGQIPEYIPGPDMGTDEICMAWIRDETGRAVGLPPELGGIPLDRIGATGFGLRAAVLAAYRHLKLEVAGARVAIQGFGSVGRHAARFLAECGARLVAASDSRGTVMDPGGLDIAALVALKDAGGSVVDHAAGQKRDRDAIVPVPCDIWIPAARPDVLRSDNVDRLDARLVVQGANIPATPEAEQRLHERGILSIPDFIANAGGVICAAVEYHGGSRAQAFDAIEERITGNTAEVLDAATGNRLTPRAAALRLATERVRTAMSFRQ